MDYAKIHTDGIKEAWKTTDKYDERSQVVMKAYLAAAQELGYKDRELKDSRKGAEVARLMCSGKYLGNAEFNPLLKTDAMYKGFAEAGESAKQSLHQAVLGVNDEVLGGSQGVAHKHGLTQANVMSVMGDVANSATQKELTSYLWSNVFDPKKSWGENIEMYGQVLSQDPVLQHYGQDIDSKRFHSIDEVAKVATQSMRGRTTVDDFVNKWGINLN